MVIITQKQALTRWDGLPTRLREVIFSEQYAATLWQICESEHLSDEKIEVIARVVGYVFMGFLHVGDLVREIQSALNLDYKIASSIFTEIDQKIFAELRNEIKEAYNPSVGITPTIKTEAEEEMPVKIATESFGPKPITAMAPEEKATAGITNRISIASKKTLGDAKETPLILHEEKSLVDERERPRIKSSVSPFNIFKSKTPAQEELVRGVIETPASKIPILGKILKSENKEKPEKRVVHYSEYRTTLGPFDSTNIIDVNKISKAAPDQTPKIDLKLDSPEKTETLKKDQPKNGKNGVKIEGNIVDLK